MKHLSVLDTLLPPPAVLSQEEHLENTVATESLYHDIKFTNGQLDHGLDYIAALENLGQVVEKIKVISLEHQVLLMSCGDFAVCGTDVHPDHAVPAMEDSEVVESEQSPADKQAFIKSTQEKIKAVVAAILAFLKKLWGHFKEFISNILSSTKTNEAHVDSFVKKFQEIKDFSKAKGYKIKVKPLILVDVSHPEGQAVAPDIVMTQKVKQYIQQCQTAVKSYNATSVDGDLEKQAILIEAILAKTAFGDSSDINGLLSFEKKNSAFNTSYFLGGLTVRTGVSPDNEASFNTEQVLDELIHLYRHNRTQATMVTASAEEVEVEVMDKPTLDASIKLLKELLTFGVEGRGTLAGSAYYATMKQQKLEARVVAALEHFSKDSSVLIQILSTNAFKRRVFANRVVPEFLSAMSSRTTAFYSGLMRNNAAIIARLMSIVARSLQAHIQLNQKAD